VGLTQTRTYIILAVVLCTLMALATTQKASAATSVTVYNNNQGNDSVAIQQAIDDADTGTATAPDVVLLDDQGGCFDLNENGTSGRAIGFGDDDQHIVVNSADSSPVCLTRPTAVGTDSYNWYHWFSFYQNGAADIALKNMTIDGNSNDADGFILHGNNPHSGYSGNTWDSILNMNPAGATPGTESTYLQDITWQNITMQDSTVFGVCGFTQHTQNLVVDNVDCLNPTKDGFTFGFGTYGVTMTDSSATLTGDDALAFNSCWENTPNGSECALAGNATVTNFVGGADIDTQNGAAFFCRGCRDVTVNNSNYNRTAQGTRSLTDMQTRASAMIEASFHPNGSVFSNPINVRLNGQTPSGGKRAIDAGATGGNSVRVAASGASNIDVVNHHLVYSASNNFCGLRITANVPNGVVDWGGNTYSQTTRKWCDYRTSPATFGGGA
jgi:hypothetical protein